MKKFLPMLVLLAFGGWCTATAQVVDPTTDNTTEQGTYQDGDATGQDDDDTIDENADGEKAAKLAAEKAEEDMWFETKSELYGRQIKHTWEYRVALAFNTSTGTSAITSDESFGFDFGLGYNVTRNIYLGVQTGICHDFGGVSGVPAGDYIPGLANVQLRLNFKKGLSFYAEGTVGVMMAITDNYQDEGMLEANVEFKRPNYMYYGLTPGLMFRPNKKLDFRLSVGYGYAVPYSEQSGMGDKTYDETIIAVKAGIGYRFK